MSPSDDPGPPVEDEPTAREEFFAGLFDQNKPNEAHRLWLEAQEEYFELTGTEMVKPKPVSVEVQIPGRHRLTGGAELDVLNLNVHRMRPKMRRRRGRICLLPGLPGRAETCFALLAHLARRDPDFDYEIVSPPGWGGSGPDPRDDYTTAHAGQVVANYLRDTARRGEETHLFGASMGGVIAVNAALALGSRGQPGGLLDSLTVANLPIRPLLRPVPNAALFLAGQLMRSDFALRLAHRFYLSKPKRVDEQYERFLGANRMTENERLALESLTLAIENAELAVADYQHRYVTTRYVSDLFRTLHKLPAALRQLPVPTLAITGEKDTMCPPHALKQVVGRLPQGDGVIIKQAGHYPHEGVPRLVSLLVSDHVRHVPPPQPGPGRVREAREKLGQDPPARRVRLFAQRIARAAEGTTSAELAEQLFAQVEALTASEVTQEVLATSPMIEQQLLNLAEQLAERLDPEHRSRITEVVSDLAQRSRVRLNRIKPPRTRSHRRGPPPP